MRFIAFETLATASLFCVTTCLADSVMLVDSHDRVVGYSTGASCGNSQPSPMWVFSAAGYYGCFVLGDGTFEQIPPLGAGTPTTGLAYISSDCTGPSFAYVSGTPYPFFGGFVFSIADTLIAVPPSDSPSQIIQLASQQEGSGACLALGGGAGAQEMSLPATVNEIAKSGFSTVPYAPPFRFDVRPDSDASDVIFFDAY